MDPMVAEEAIAKKTTMLHKVRACMRAESLAEEAEFFSFGTNDLTQAVFSFLDQLIAVLRVE